MPGHDLIVVGASAGGVEALSGLVRGLPAGRPAAIFVVHHFPVYSISVLQIRDSERHGETIRQVLLSSAPGPGRLDR